MQNETIRVVATVTALADKTIAGTSYAPANLTLSSVWKQMTKAGMSSRVQAGCRFTTPYYQQFLVQCFESVVL